jgi:hypothetical protein
MTPIICINISHLRPTHAALINSKQQHDSTSIILRYNNIKMQSSSQNITYNSHNAYTIIYISSVTTLNHLITT